jgi:hypothetical protein
MSDIDGAVEYDRKDMEDKPNLLMMPYEALAAFSVVSDYGNRKYGDRNSWQHSRSGVETYANAAVRHLFKSRLEPIDQESTLPHLYHALWSVSAAIWHFDRKTLGTESRMELR